MQLDASLVERSEAAMIQTSLPKTVSALALAAMVLPIGGCTNIGASHPAYVTASREK